jgi:hypothetical protein
MAYYLKYQNKLPDYMNILERGELGRSEPPVPGSEVICQLTNEKRPPLQSGLFCYTGLLFALVARYETLPIPSDNLVFRTGATCFFPTAFTYFYRAGSLWTYAGLRGGWNAILSLPARWSLVNADGYRLVFVSIR